MRRLYKWGLLPWIVFLPACPAPREEPGEELRAIDEKISKMETDLGEINRKMKIQEGDRGLRDQLREDEALMKSRIERLRERAKSLRPTPGPRR